MLVDCTKGVQNLHDIKDVIVAGFQWASEEVCILTMKATDVLVYLSNKYNSKHEDLPFSLSNISL